MKSNRGPIAAIATMAMTCALLWAHPGLAWVSTPFCAPNLGTLPSTSRPTFDGLTPGCDPKWLGAFKYSVGMGVAENSAVVQAVQQTNSMGQPSLDMTFEIPGNADCSSGDGFLVAFDLGGGNFRKIVATATDTGACNAGTHAQLHYYTGVASAATPGGVAWTEAAGPPANTLLGFNFSTPSAPCTTAGGATIYLHFELQLQLSSIGMNPTTHQYGMYWAVLGTHDAIAATSEFTWPAVCADPNSSTGGCIGDPFGNLCHPNDPTSCITPDQWGTLNLASTCPGVSVSQIGVNLDPTPGSATSTNIGSNKANYFHATVKNTGAAAAPGVMALFRIANFGSQFSTNPWIQIPVPGNPTPGVSIPTGPAGQDIVLGPYTPDPGLYTDPGDPYGLGHQCVLVQLSSNSTVNFTSASMYTNMNIKPLSAEQSLAELDTRGLGAPAGGAATHHIAYYVKSSRQYAYGDGSYQGLPLGNVAAQLGWTFYPYRITDKTVTMRQQTYKLAFPGPAFGYVALHDMGASFVQPFNSRPDVVQIANTVSCVPPVILENKTVPKRTDVRPLVVVGGGPGGPGRDAGAPSSSNPCPVPPQPRFYQAANALLAQDSYRPAPEDFTTRVDGMVAVAGHEGWYIVDLAPESVTKIAGSVGYGDAGLPPPPVLTPDAGADGGADAGPLGDGGPTPPCGQGGPCPPPPCNCRTTADTQVTSYGALAALAAVGGLFIGRRARRRRV